MGESQPARHCQHFIKVIVVPYTDPHPDPTRVPNGVLFEDFPSKENGLEITFEQVPV